MQRITPMSSSQSHGRDGALRRPGMDAQVDSNSRTPQRGVPTRPIRKRLAHDVPLCIFLAHRLRKGGRLSFLPIQLGAGLVENAEDYPMSSSQSHGRDGALRRPAMDAKVDSNSRTPQRGVPTRPIRKRLAHDVPLWIDPSKARYFITVCCKRRGKNQLAIPDPGYAVLETIIYRHARGIWYAHLALLMPDHAHLIVSFPRPGSGRKRLSANGRNGRQSPFGSNGSGLLFYTPPKREKI